MVEVVCALIFQNGKILITQLGPDSSHPYKWEFPGGKVNNGESEEEAIAREIKEELGIEVSVISGLEPIQFVYPGKSIRLAPFICLINSGEIVLAEHTDMAWTTATGLPGFDLLGADRQIFVCPANKLILSDYFRENVD